MSAKIGSLNVNLDIETARFNKGLDAAQRKLKDTQKQFSAIGSKLQGLGTKMAIGITAPFAAFAASSAKAAVAARDAIGQVEASLNSMGDGAGRSLAQLEKSAKGLEAISAFDDKEILRKTTSVLLTFGNVAGEQFDRAQQAAVDMASKLGTDLQPATIQIGKALNDPIKGVSALTEVGVTFTEQQKAQIEAMQKAGDVAGAQNIILAELERQFKGAGQAARDAAPGSDTLNKWSDLQENVGAKVLDAFAILEPYINRVIDAFNNLSPEMKKTTVIIAAVAAAAGPLLIVTGSIFKAVGTLLPVLKALGPILNVVRIAMLAIAANPIILGLAAVIGGIYLAWKNWDKISAIAKNVYNGVKTWLMDKLGPIFEWVGRKIEQFKGFFEDAYTAIVGNSYVPDMVDEIGAHMKRLDSLMVDQARSATGRTAEAFKQLRDDLRPLLSELFPEEAIRVEYRRKQDTLEQGLRDGEISPQRFQEAMERAQAQYWGERPKGPAPTVEAAPIGGVGDLDASIRKLGENIKPTILQVNQLSADLRKGFGMAFAEIGFQLEGLITGAQSFGDALKNLAARFSSFAFEKAWSGLGSALGVSGFARGTRSAPPGWHWVGEEGPELLRFRGGEQVMPSVPSLRFAENFAMPALVTGLDSARVYSRGDGGGAAAPAASSVTHNWNVRLQDGDGFNRNQRQIERQMKRRM